MTDDQEKQPLDRALLKANKNDAAAAVLRGAAGAVPLAGGILAELVNHVIPNQRVERLAAFMEQLADLPEARLVPDLETTLRQPSNVDLFETGAFQAARALSPERLKYIGEAVANGIAAEDRRKLHHKRLLSILAELDDEEIALLLAHAEGTSWKLSPPDYDPHAQEERVTWEEARAMWEAAHNKLERLQFLNFRETMKELPVHVDRDGHRRESVHVPERDAWGERRGHYVVTDLGTMLLESTGLVRKKRRNTLDEFLKEQAERGKAQST